MCGYQIEVRVKHGTYILILDLRPKLDGCNVVCDYQIQA